MLPLPLFRPLVIRAALVPLVALLAATSPSTALAYKTWPAGVTHHYDSKTGKTTDVPYPAFPNAGGCTRLFRQWSGGYEDDDKMDSCIEFMGVAKEAAYYYYQRDFVQKCCKTRGIRNVSVFTADINEFACLAAFDRVVSIEMFEHVRNYGRLLKNIASWLKPEGKLFVHIFCHGDYAYTFETNGEDNWMGRYFFSGGIMPSDDLLLHFQDDLILEDRWRLDGTHYHRTAEHWLSNIDARKMTVIPLLEQTYGSKEAHIWFQRWRMFLMACSELFAFRNGQEWRVAHYLFRKRRDESTRGEPKPAECAR